MRCAARSYAEESRGAPMRTVWWEAGTVRLLDQTRLPGETAVRTCRTWEEVADAIRRLQVRGAPAIGAAGAAAAGGGGGGGRSRGGPPPAGARPPEGWARPRPPAVNRRGALDLMVVA